MGCVFRQAGRHTWLLKYYRDGRPIVESSKTTDKEVAKAILRERETDRDRGVPLAANLARITFDEAATDIENDYRMNDRATLDHVKRRLKLHLLPVFGGRRLTAITTSDIRAFVAARQKAGASNAEINRELSIIGRMYRLAMEAGKIYHSPHIKKLQERNVRQGFFEREQFDAVRKRLPAWLQGAITFAYLTGWRIQSEVLSLEWRQVDFAAGVVRLEPHTTKNAEGRTFPFNLLPELRATLKEQETRTTTVRNAGRICPWVFHDDGISLLTDSGIAIKAVREAWKSACKSAGVPGKIPHDFRRTAVRNLVRAGVSEKVAMQLTGHKTRAVFDRYDIVNEADLRSAVQKLAMSAKHVART